MSFLYDDEDTDRMGPMDISELMINEPEPNVVVWKSKTEPIQIPENALSRFFDQNNLDPVLDKNSILENPSVEYYQIDLSGNTYTIQPKRRIYEDELFSENRRFAKDMKLQQGGKRKSKKSKKSNTSKKSKKSNTSRKSKK